jgi:hypothetical protein
MSSLKYRILIDGMVIVTSAEVGKIVFVISTAVKKESVSIVSG